MSSDEALSRVTYTSISSDYEEPSNLGSPRVVIYRYDGLNMHPVDPSSPDYMPGPEEPEQAPLSPDYVSGLEYPEYLALSNEEVRMEDQPYAAADSPIALSLGYIANSNPKEDLKDESVDGPTGYPADKGDDDDSSGDNVDDEDEEEASKEDEEEEEEEHLAPADFTTAASPVIDHVPSAEETEPFETDESAVTPPPPPAYQIDRLFSIPTPPPSPLTSLSSPLPQISSPPLPISSPPLPLPSPLATSPYAGAPLGYRVAGILLRTGITTTITFILTTTIITTYHTSMHQSIHGFDESRHTVYLHPSTLIEDTTIKDTTIRADVLEAVLLPQKRLCIALGPRFEVRERSFAVVARQTRRFRADYGFVGTLDADFRRDPDREVGYRITDVWVDPAEAIEEIPPTTLVELSQRVTNFVTTVRSTCYTEIAATMPTLLYLLRERLGLPERHGHNLWMPAIGHVLRTKDSDRLTQHIQNEHDPFKEFQRTRDVAPEDADSSS
ncbi:hypothetical protein Tco_1167675 [Tanacetum coccineum]